LFTKQFDCYPELVAQLHHPLSVLRLLVILCTIILVWYEQVVVQSIAVMQMTCNRSL